MNKMRISKAIIVISIYLSISLVSANVPPKDLIPVTISYDGTPDSNFLFPFMESIGVFEKNGLNVTGVYSQTAKETTDKLFSGEAGFSVLNTYSVADAAVNGGDPIILTSVLKVENLYFLVVNNKAGINAPKDLIGKRIGLITGDYWEYYLNRFLILNDIDPASVTKVPLALDETIADLNAGQIDAGVMMWAPALKLTSKEPERFQMWSIINNENFYGLLICNRDIRDNHPEIVEKVIRSHIDAADWYNNNREQSITLISEKTGLYRIQLKVMLNGIPGEINLRQSLLNSLQDQTNYIISQNKGSNRESPEYLDLMDFSFLDRILPGSVTIIHE